MDALLVMFGEGSDLSPFQMSARAILFFFVTLVFIRLSGRRSFGQHKPFDACVTVLLGAVLSRAVVGASPMVATTVACACVVLLHRLVAYLAALSPHVDRIVNGDIRVLASRGRIDAVELRRGLVTLPEVQHAIRMRTRTDALAARYTVILERNGDITVVDLTEEGNAK
jgi:uncharacterized membrane protein YcaP (DUF421 family)